MATLNLRFDPASADEQPPQLGGLQSKLKIYTFFGAAAYRIIPEIGRCDNWSNLHGHYPESMELSARNIGGVSWTKHGPGCDKKSIARRASEATTSDLSRRSSNSSTLSGDSVQSTDSIPVASAAYDPLLPFYTAKILVPVTLPHQSASTDTVIQPGLPPISKTTRNLSRHSRKVVFVPTFHTCIISRTYTLELNLTFHPVNSAGATTNTLGTPSVSLRVPIQISQEGSNPESPLYSYEDAQARALAMAQLQTASDEYDELVARQLDREINQSTFRNPFSDTVEMIPEYEEIQTTLPYNMTSRHESFAAPSGRTAPAQEQPPEYYSPFRNPAHTGPARRHSDVVTRLPLRPIHSPIAFLSAL